MVCQSWGAPRISYKTPGERTAFQHKPTVISYKFEDVDMVGWNHGTTKVLIYLNLAPERKKDRSRVEFF